MEKENQRNQHKEHIREAFSKAAQVVVIPPTKDIDHKNKPSLRVAAYCRVSTLEEKQTGSFELQCQHYREYIDNR